jgi:hypothetical protein
VSEEALAKEFPVSPFGNQYRLDPSESGLPERATTQPRVARVAYEAIQHCPQGTAISEGETRSDANDDTAWVSRRISAPTSGAGSGGQGLRGASVAGNDSTFPKASSSRDVDLADDVEQTTDRDAGDRSRDPHH